MNMDSGLSARLARIRSSRHRKAGRIPTNQLQPGLERLEIRSLLTAIGTPDPSFASNGEYIIPIQPTGTDGIINVYAMQVQSDNEVDIGGISGFASQKTYSILQMNPNGTPDTSFGQNGTAEVAMPSGFYANAKLYAEQIQSDGKIVIAGTIQNGVGLQETLVARFNTDGTPDTSFGTDGISLITTPGIALNYEAIQTNGKIVLAGETPIAVGVTGNTETAVVRLNADGSLDNSFGTGGMITLDSVATSTRATAAVTEKATGVAIAPDGQIVLFGDTSIPQVATPTAPDLTAQIDRLNANGTQDTSLSESGVQQANFAQADINGVIVQPNGQIDLLGNAPPSYPNGPPLLAQLNENGTLAGTVSFPDPNRGYVVNAFALQADGKIVITGDQFSTEWFAFRINANLTMDDTFGVDGETQFVISNDVKPKAAAAEVVAIAPDGEIILGGTSNYSTSLVISEITGGDAANPGSGPAAPVSVPEVAGDYLGDGYAQPTIYLPSQGAFVIRSQGSTADITIPFGLAGQGATIPVPGDYDGSGQTELAAYLPSLAEYAYRPADGGPDVTQTIGIPGSGQTLPAPGNYDGVGHDEVAVYIASLGEFAISEPGGLDKIVPFGIAGVGQTIPTPGDYFGTGVTDIAAYLPSIGAYAIRNPAGGPDEIIPFGIAGAGNSIPVSGDYDNSGKTELAVYLPQYALFIYRPADGGPDVTESFGMAGEGNTIPVPGDYDGSGKTEFAAYLPSTGEFAWRPSNGPDVLIPYGVVGTGQTLPVSDVPIESDEAGLMMLPVDQSTTTSAFDTITSATTTAKKKKA
jgi:uncharacterized delta-60 repeat protein